MDDEGERARLHAEQDHDSPCAGLPDEHGVPTVEPAGELLAPAALPEPRAELIVHPDVPAQRTSR